MIGQERTGDLEAEPGRTPVHDDAFSNIGGRERLKRYFLVDGLAFFSPYETQGLRQVHSQLAFIEPSREFVEVQRFLEECATQVFDRTPVESIGITRNERLIPGDELALSRCLGLEHFDAVHAGHAEVDDHDVGTCVVRSTLRIDFINGTYLRLKERKDIVAPQGKKLSQQTRNNDIVIIDNGASFSHDRLLYEADSQALSECCGKETRCDLSRQMLEPTAD